MKKLCTVLILFALYFLNCGFDYLSCSDEDLALNAGVKNIYLAASYQPNVDRLEQMFKQKINLDKGVIFTKVPRGLVISFDESIFFNKGDAKIKEHSLYILDVLASGLQKIPNDCVIEDHTDENMDAVSDYNYDWEISLARASNISQYLIDCGCISANRMFALGYGEYMPFKDNVSSLEGIDNRIDVVILEYEAKR